MPLYAPSTQLDLPLDPPAVVASAHQFETGNPAPVGIKPLPIPRRSSVLPDAGKSAQPAQRAPDRLLSCLAAANADLAAGRAAAEAWRREAKEPAERARAGQCLGWIEARAGRMPAAQRAFAGAIAALPGADQPKSAALYAMAGNAALGAGDARTALQWLDVALLPTSTLNDDARGNVQTDRARALVALGRVDEARDALAKAHLLAPDDGEGWLLSATLARRANELDRAQHDIELAGKLLPREPAVGLEAGVIAVLDGRDEAARKSWQSVIAAAPDTPEAKQAQAYIGQLGPAPAGAAVAPAVAPSGPKSQENGR